MRRAAGLADALLLLVILVWAVNFSVVKASIAHIPPMSFNALRLLGSSGLLLALSRLSGQGGIPRRELGRVVGLGIVGHTAYQTCFILGLEATTATSSALLLGATPVLVVLVAALTGAESPTRRALLGVFISILGIYLVVRPRAGQPATPTGELLTLAASLCWAVYTVGSVGLLSRHGPLKVTAYTMVAGTLFFLPLSLPSVYRTLWGSVPAAVWAAIAYSFLLALGFGYYAWYYGVARLGPTRTAMYSNFTPIAALAISALTLRERPGWAQALGAAVIFLGVYLVRASGADRSSGPPD
jgi:drug/metabolite transporter (DMT)-like permease